MLRRMLEQEGHEVTETANDAWGLRLYEQDASDLIITDIIMPEREGVETIIALRRADPELPIIAISGGGRLAATDFLSMAKKLGARHTLSKPFGRDQLLEAVSECPSSGPDIATESLDRIRIDRTHIVGSIDPVNPV